MQKMVHIVFQQADVSVLQKALDLDPSLQGPILEIRDDFAVGPIQDIYGTEGYQARREWWKQVLEYSSYVDTLDIVDDKLTVHNLIKSLQEDDSLQAWIWMGQNAHDVCGYYWLMSQLREFQGRLYILYLNNLPFINEKGGIFYPGTLHEIQPKEFLKAKKLARLITLSEFEIDPDEWKKLCNENAGVRILEGGKKIAGKEPDYYDKEILNAVTPDFQKLNKVLNQAFTKMKITTGDVFLVWRLRQLVQQGILDIQGDWNKGWKEIEIKKKAVQGETVNAE